MQHCGSHLAFSYQKSGVHACLAGQEMGQRVQNARKLWFTLQCGVDFFIFYPPLVILFSGPQKWEPRKIPSVTNPMLLSARRVLKTLQRARTGPKA